jgi:hypothetical protein
VALAILRVADDRPSASDRLRLTAAVVGFGDSPELPSGCGLGIRCKGVGGRPMRQCASGLLCRA